MGAIIPNMGPNAADESLGGALFTGVQQRVLGALFGNPSRSYFGNELLRLTKSGKGALQRELARLQRVGLITTRTIGTQKHYQANRDAPIFEELHGIVIKTFGMADVLREALAPLVADITTAFIYGSVAKRTDTAQSDIDLFIVSESLPYAALLGAMQDPEMRLGRKINPMLMSRAELRRKREDDSGFAARVLAQPKVMIIGSEDDLAKP